jgi:PEP-CTERM motif-containing protein
MSKSAGLQGARDRIWARSPKAVKRSTRIAFAIAAALAAAVPAQATVTLWNGNGANDTIQWGQVGEFWEDVWGPLNVTSNGGLNATVTDADNYMVRRDQNVGWNGNFAPGEELLLTDVTGNPLVITFASPVQAAGAQIEWRSYGPFEAFITTNDGSFFFLDGESYPGGDNSAIFLGVQSDSANITSIAFMTEYDNFAIGRVNLISGATGEVPEPSTWAMMLLGFGAIGASLRRGRRKLLQLA